MTTQVLRDKVEARLIKNGKNVNDVKNMMSENFEYASKTYPTVKSIAECIISIW